MLQLSCKNMKIVQEANKNILKLTLAELQKEAMPVRPTAPTKTEMKEQGWFVDPEFKHKTPIPNVGVRKVQEIDKELSISLPKIFKLKEKDIRHINNADYIIIDIDPARKYLKRQKGVDLIEKDGGLWYPGKVRVINLANGNVEVFAHDDIKDQLESQANRISEESRKKINQEIAKYNKRIDELDAATANLSRLPLQLGRVDSMLNERIETLNGIIASKEAELEESKTMPSGVEKFHSEVSENIAGGGLPEKDFIDHVLYRYIGHYDQLVKDLKDGNLQIPANLGNQEAVKQKLMSLGDLAFKELLQSREDAHAVAPKKPFNIMDFQEGKLEDIPEGAVPTSDKATGYSSYESYSGSLYNTIQNSQKDLSQLQTIKNDILNIGQTIGNSPKNEEFLSSPEGQTLVQQLIDLCNNGLSPFVERYSKGIVENGRIDTRKMGSGGQIGNALLIVVFVRIYKIIATMLAKAGKPIQSIDDAVVESSKTTAPEQNPVNPVNPAPANPVNPEDQVKASSKKTIKLSKAQWLNIGKQAGWLKVSQS